MRLSGCLSNLPRIERIHKAIEARSKLTISDGPKSSPRDIRPKQGAIQEAVIAVLEEHSQPLGPAAVRGRVSVLLEREVSYDTISSFLSVASRNEKWPITRVSTGFYGLRK